MSIPFHQLKGLTTRNLISALKRDGFALVHKKGSHHTYNKGHYYVTIPYHHSSQTFPPKTLKAIIRDTHWTEYDLKRLKLIK